MNLQLSYDFSDRAVVDFFSKEERCPLSAINNVLHRSRAFISKRLWVLAVLFFALCALAMLQYHWIGQVAEAERQRAKSTLSLALSELETEFDIEVTRAFLAFQLPATDADYAERYRQWRRLAPYPGLVRGVYILDTGKGGPLLNPVAPGEPAIHSTDWQKDVSRFSLPVAMRAVSGPFPPPDGFHLSSRGRFAVSAESRGPQLMIEGNPAFVFPIMPRSATAGLIRVRGPAPEFRRMEIGKIEVAGPPTQFAAVVLDADYIRTVFLPWLVNAHFPNGSASNYDILVVNKTKPGEPQAVFHLGPSHAESGFEKPEGDIPLFKLRVNCFTLAPPAGLRIVGGAEGAQSVAAGMSPSEVLAQRPANCTSPEPTTGPTPAGPWEMLVRYREGSLDQAITTFRRRNLLLSCGVLFVLAAGILMLTISAERARALAEMQAEFLLGVSHELRTPLTVIRVAADNLRKGVAESSEQVHKYGEIIGAHAVELSKMMEETLAFARARSIRPLSNLTSVSPERIIRDSLASCEDALRNAGMEVEVQLDPELPLIEVDASLVRKCLENLIQNAIKYASQGGWMAIRAKKAIQKGGQNLQIIIEDKGPGISPIDLPHVFEPFYRGKTRDGSQVFGIGLGLTLVKRIVEAHQGRVEVESSGRIGTLVSMYLPFQQIGSHAPDKLPK